MSRPDEPPRARTADVVRGLVYTHNRANTNTAEVHQANATVAALVELLTEQDGYCTHMERGTCRCTIHAHRPIPCRGYDCRKDQRIWLDFDNMVTNPQIDEPGWPENAGAQAASPGGVEQDG